MGKSRFQLADPDGLTVKQRRMVEEFFVCGQNQSEAMRRAGYAPKWVQNQTALVFGLPGVKAAIRRRQAELQNKTQLTQEWVLNNLAEVAERCKRPEPVVVREGSRIAQATEQVSCPGCGESVAVALWRFDSAGANRAIELIGKTHAMFTDKVVGSFTVEQHEAKLVAEVERAFEALCEVARESEIPDRAGFVERVQRRYVEKLKAERP